MISNVKCQSSNVKNNMKSYRLLLVFLSFFFLAFLLYLPTLNAPWQFDDLEHVLRRNSVGQDSLTKLLSSTVLIATDPKGTRSLVNATFLLNWKINPHPSGFHLVNILIHASTSLVVFLLLKELLSRVYGKNNLFILSLLGALIFLVHPLQSQAVAYVTQRYESLMTLFYLASLYFFLTRRFLWSLLCAFFAASSKEIAITLPVVIVGLDWFFAGFTRRILKKRLLLYFLFGLLSLKIVLQLFSDSRYPGLMAQPGSFLTKLEANTRVIERNQAMTRGQYLLTQLNVIPVYLRLLILPYGQTIDYDFPITNSFWQWPTPLSAAFLVSLIVIMVFFARRQSLLSFAILFFFTTLSVSSSIFPIDDVINEHRVYLPMFGFVVFVVWLTKRLTQRLQGRGESWVQKVRFILITILLLFSLLTFRRSLVWSIPLNLWEDAWAKAPNKARTNKNYGFLLTENGRLVEGITRLKRAVELNDSSDYRRNLGLAYLKAQDYQQAEAAFRLAVERDPTDSKPPSDLGVALAQQGKYPEAIAAFRRSLELNPNLFEAMIGIGGVSILTGDLATAEEFLLKAIQTQPNDPRGYNNLAILYLQKKDPGKAREVLAKLSSLDPNFPGLQERLQELKKIERSL